MKYDELSYRERVYRIVRSIPPGRLMTYGQIAVLLGEGYTARTVGYVMHAAAEANVPWQRVVNAAGACSTAKFTMPSDLQQRMLEREGVRFNDKGKCRLDEYLFSPDGFDDDDDQISLFGG